MRAQEIFNAILRGFLKTPVRDEIDGISCFGPYSYEKDIWLHKLEMDL